MIHLYTIGFTKKSAERFFHLLENNNIEILVDIRLKPDIQLSGFAKKGDLPFFMKRIVNGKYVHLPILAPTAEILSEYRKNHDWEHYAEKFEELMSQRNVPSSIDKLFFEQHRTCLLCSEHEPDHCHRTLVANRLSKYWGDVRIVHLS